MLYSSYLGSTGSANGALVDWGQDIALDDAGNAYVTGHSNSTDFITTPGAYQESDPTPDGYGLEHAFVAKLDPSQSGAASLVYSTYLGGNVGDGADFGYGIAVDGAGNAYVVGTTESTNFPVTAGVVQPTSGGGTGDTFVTKLNADGSALVYSSYLGGSNSDVGRANGDVLQESNESLFVNLSGPTNAEIVDSQGVATIRDDDTTRFYVVDDAAADRTFEYADPGNSIENYALLSGNTTPRGAASNVAGDKVWVADANKKVYVYNTSGGLLGSWTAGTLQSTAQVEGLATNGTDIWIVDNKVDKVYKYTGAATRLTGSQNAASSFNLNSSNSNPKGIVTDGTSIWVVNDASADKVFKYSLTGTLLGSWTIDAANSTPTGLTIDPTNVNHIWIVDSGTDKVYQYDAATSRTSGSQSAAATFPLATGNANPQDIADPRFVDEVQNPAPIAMALARWDNGSPVTATRSAEPLATEDRAASSVQEHNHDLALLVLVEESSVDLITGPSKIRRNRMPDAGLISLRAADECFGENEYH